MAKQRAEEARASKKQEWHVTGEWHISCPAFEKKFEVEGMMKLTIYTSTTSSCLQIFSEFDFGIVAGVFRFEEQSASEPRTEADSSTIAKLQVAQNNRLNEIQAGGNEFGAKIYNTENKLAERRAKRKFVELKRNQHEEVSESENGDESEKESEMEDDTNYWHSKTENAVFMTIDSSAAEIRKAALSLGLVNKSLEVSKFDDQESDGQCQLFGEFDFGGVSVLFWFEQRLPTVEKKSARLADPNVKREKITFGKAEKEKKNDNDKDNKCASPNAKRLGYKFTAEAFSFPSPEKPSLHNPTWNYRWRGEYKIDSEPVPGQYLCSTTFSEPLGTTLTGTFGGHLYKTWKEDMVFTVVKFGVGGAPSIDIEKEWHNKQNIIYDSDIQD
ncbi:uncharacterized protein EAE97_001982 [Botrytis byssoidea]|uniref:Uncharacterized protein n=1 Tax=Botrytis byssoidea TaxID=139641 RepID=A0A9P5LYE9_9HELO|nr:uncharacterized protein EAE97_001982 [Botrytis byssoidea]KAF7952485.1 hypothetical protein EAE97_001982 [Botrytis byssoidea]